MANEEHLKILLQGVEVWNQWRQDNLEITPNLRDANLRDANLRDADLRDADLQRAWLGDADLSGVDLSNANLRRVDLSRAYLSKGNFRGANLQNAYLIGAKFYHVDLSDADLSGADLGSADLSGANLGGANLSGANLKDADLRGANLQDANLTLAFLAVVRLIYAKLDRANLTGVNLWATQRAEWSIKGIICEYVYWDVYTKEKTEYAPGEFERLFAEQTKIRLFYKDGISPLEVATLPAFIQHLANSHPEGSLRFVSIHEDSGGAVVELAIEDIENSTPEQITQLQTALQTEAQAKVEYQRQALIERDTRLQLEGKVQQLDSLVDRLLLRQGNTFNNYGQAGAFGANPHAHHNTFHQHVTHFEQSIDLSALTKELSELRQAIAKQDSSPQTAIALGRVAEAELAAIEKDTSKVIEHLKAAGIWTLDFARDMGKDVVAEAIKQAIGMG
jgi:hypothetical protein